MEAAHCLMRAAPLQRSKTVILIFISSPAPPKVHSEHRKDHKVHENDCQHEAEPGAKDHGGRKSLCPNEPRYHH